MAAAPAGSWKVMVFYLDPARRRGICDYLDPKAVDELIEIMYDQYYDHLKEYFGKVIKMSFYDEPSLHNAVSGRLWTPGFNEGLQKKYGYGPMTVAIRAFTYDFKTFFAHPHPAGGKAYFLPRPEPKPAAPLRVGDGGRGAEGGSAGARYRGPDALAVAGADEPGLRRSFDLYPRSQERPRHLLLRQFHRCRRRYDGRPARPQEPGPLGPPHGPEEEGGRHGFGGRPPARDGHTPDSSAAYVCVLHTGVDWPRKGIPVVGMTRNQDGKGSQTRRIAFGDPKEPQ